MTAHEATEATMSSAMTACTMGLASSTKVQIDKSLPIAPLHEQVLGDGTWFQRAGIETGNARARVDQLGLAAQDGLLERNCRTAQPLEFGSDDSFIIEDRGKKEVDCDAHHGELQPAVEPQSLLIDAEKTQPLGAASLHELEVVRVVDDAAGVGVFPIYSLQQFELFNH